MSTNARDFFLARLAAARARAAAAVDAIDAILEFSNDPSEDKGGKLRREALEIADGSLGSAAIGVQLAMAAFEDVDLKEEEPDEYDGDEDEEEDEEDEEDEDEDEDEEDEEEEADPGDEQPPKRARRRR